MNVKKTKSSKKIVLKSAMSMTVGQSLVGPGQHLSLRCSVLLKVLEASTKEAVRPRYQTTG